MDRKKMKKVVDLGLIAAVSFGLALQVACSSDNNNGSDESESAITDEHALAPEAGQFPAEVEDDCSDGVATLDAFVADPDLGTVLDSLTPNDYPAIGDVLASGDPDLIPIIAGFQEDTSTGDYLPISADEVDALLEGAGVPTDTLVLGKAPVACDDVFAGDPNPDNFQDIDPTDAMAMLPIFADTDADDLAEELVGMVLVVVENGNPDLEDLVAVELPDVDPENDAEVPQELTDIIDDLVGPVS